MEELAHEDAQKYNMSYWYERAVDEQKKELRDYRKGAKAQVQPPHVEPVPLTIEEDLSEGQGDMPEVINV